MENIITREIANNIKDYADTLDKGELDVDQIVFIIEQAYDYFDLNSVEDQ